LHIPCPANRSPRFRNSIGTRELDFVSTHKLTGKKVYFTILAGTEGPLRGVPVQIRYQPNWWFQAVLNLAPGNPAPTSPTRASR
jgi:hypothetical protein